MNLVLLLYKSPFEFKEELRPPDMFGFLTLFNFCFIISSLSIFPLALLLSELVDFQDMPFLKASSWPVIICANSGDCF